MEFDKSKVYTVFNCDELKVGSEGYFADTKVDLISRVQCESETYYNTLSKIYDSDEYIYNNTVGCTHRYFYLVEEPKEKAKRPCTREELLEMLKKQGILMLKPRFGNRYFTIENASDTNVFMSGNYSYKELCEGYTLLDGTELWVEE